MDHLPPLQGDLKKHGWALLLNDKEALNAKVGDIVKLMIEVVSPLDFEAEEIRSVSHETLWVEITENDVVGFRGILKTTLSHDVEIKDGTKFAIGDRISFSSKNIFAIR